MKLATLVLTTLLTPLLAQAQECHLEKSDTDVVTCLNKYAVDLLTEEAPRGLRDRYQAELSQALANAGISHFDMHQTKSLAEAFTIAIPAVKNPLDSTDAGCFSFHHGTVKNLTRGGKSYVVQAIQKQMKEAAYFLKTAHAWSLGNSSSHLFQIRRVEICSEAKASAHFTRGVLRLNMAFKLTGASLYKAEEILSEWNNGSLVFGPEMGFIKEKISGLKGDIPAVVKNKIRPAWLVLNPLGDIRYQLRLAFLNRSGKTLMEWSTHATHASATQALSAKFQELGLPSSALPTTEAEALAVQERFAEVATDTDFLNQALEQLLVGVNGGSHSVAVVDNRVNLGLIAIKNNKQISINLAHLFPTPLQMSTELEEAQAASANQVSAQLTGKNIGLIAVDLFDQVAVNVVPPNIINLLERLSLKEATQRAAQGLQNRALNIIPN